MREGQQVGVPGRPLQLGDAPDQLLPGGNGKESTWPAGESREARHTYTTKLRVIRRLWGGKNQLMTTAMIVMMTMLVVRPRVGDDAR